MIDGKKDTAKSGIKIKTSPYLILEAWVTSL